MQPKKNPKVSLENKKAMFFQIGLAVTLLSILIAFEWKSYDKSNYNLGDLNLDDMEEEIIPITRQEVKPPPPPPPPPEIIEIVEDEVEIVDGHVIPEFGVIAAMILAVAIVSIIVVTAKTKLSIVPRY